MKPKLRTKSSFRALTRAWDKAFGSPASTTSSSRLSSSALSSPATQTLNSELSTSELLEPPPPSLQANHLPVSHLPKPSFSTSSTPQEHMSTLSSTTPWSGLNRAIRALYKSSALFPPLQSALGGLIHCIETVEESTKNRTEYETLALELTMLGVSLDRHLQVSKSALLSESIAKIAQGIQEQANIIVDKQSRSGNRRLLEIADDRDTLTNCYRRIQALFRQLQVDADLSTWGIANEQLANTRLESMRPVKLAVYNSSLSADINRRTCTENTRIGILSGLKNWISDPGAPNVYWMNGMAGTGKTTIACTFAGILKEQKQLAASFFCTSATAECQDATRILPTISYQLARYSIPFQSALCRVLGSDPDLAYCEIPTQFKKLLREPLLEVKGSLPDGLAVVIDALDECTARNEVKSVLDMLLREASNLPLRFFVSTRPDPSIQSKFQERPESSRHIYELHHVKPLDVQADIELYLRAELPLISQSEVRRLAELSGTLFIYAATAVRYIRAGNPKERLKKILSAESTFNKGHVEIDGLYTTILSAAFDNNMLDEEEKEQMRLVLWTTICARERISVKTLAVLTGVGDSDAVLEALNPLRSVIHVSESGEVVSTLHASFPDFMFNQARSSRFYCEAEEQNGLLARRCLEILKQQLRFNICELESSYLLDEKVPNLEERIDRAISPTLAYSCRFWSDHLRRSPTSNALCDLLSDFLAKRLLFWMEVMNLKRWMGIGVRMIAAAKVWLMGHHPSSELSKWAEDAHNFVTSFAANAISQSTPHIYVSALPFCHRSSTIYRHYWSQTRGLIEPKGLGIDHRYETTLASWKVDPGVNSVAYSPNGTCLALGCGDGSVMVKDVHDGSLITVFSIEGTGVITSLVFSPDSAHIVCGLDDLTIRIWDVYNSVFVGAPFKGDVENITSVALSSDGTRVAASFWDYTIHVWNAQDGSPVGVACQGHTDQVTSLAFSPNNRQVVSGSKDHTVRIWDVQSGTLVKTPLEGHANQVNSVAFSPDGNTVVSGSSDRTVRIWNMQASSPIGAPLTGHTNWINSVAFSPDGTRVASGSSDRTIRVWNVQHNTLVGVPFEGHTDRVNSVTFSPDGTRIVSGSADSTVRIWSTRNKTSSLAPAKSRTGWVRSVAFSPDGTCIVSSDGTICVRGVEPTFLYDALFKGHTGDITSVGFSPDGSYVVSGSSDHTVCVWYTYDGKLVQAPLLGHTDWVNSVTFSPDGKQIASGSSDRTIRVWDTRCGSPVGAPFQGHTAHITSVAFSPNGKLIVSGSGDSTVRIWNVYNGTHVILKGHTSSVMSVSFSPNGTCVASGSRDCTVRIWNTDDGTLLSDPFRGHSDDVRSVAFSPDGARVVSASSDRTICIWNVQDGTLVGAPLVGHTNWVRCVGFSPDGTCIVSGSNDGSIRIWTTSSSTHKISTWIVTEDGWVVDQDSHLLFWVPVDLAPCLPTPYNSCVVGPTGPVHADYRSLLIGGDWHNCYTLK